MNAVPGVQRQAVQCAGDTRRGELRSPGLSQINQWCRDKTRRVRPNSVYKKGRIADKSSVVLPLLCVKERGRIWNPPLRRGESDRIYWVEAQSTGEHCSPLRFPVSTHSPNPYLLSSNHYLAPTWGLAYHYLLFYTLLKLRHVGYYTHQPVAGRQDIQDTQRLL